MQAVDDCAMAKDFSGLIFCKQSGAPANPAARLQAAHWRSLHAPNACARPDGLPWQRFTLKRWRGMAAELALHRLPPPEAPAARPPASGRRCTAALKPAQWPAPWRCGPAGEAMRGHNMRGWAHLAHTLLLPQNAPRSPTATARCMQLVKRWPLRLSKRSHASLAPRFSTR
jgi:hypothetical protein